MVVRFTTNMAPHRSLPKYTFVSGYFILIIGKTMSVQLQVNIINLIYLY